MRIWNYVTQYCTVRKIERGSFDVTSEQLISPLTERIHLPLIGRTHLPKNCTLFRQ